MSTQYTDDIEDILLCVRCQIFCLPRMLRKAFAQQSLFLIVIFEILMERIDTLLLKSRSKNSFGNFESRAGTLSELRMRVIHTYQSLSTCQNVGIVKHPAWR